MLRSNLETELRENVSEFPKTVEPVEAAAKIKINVRLDYRGQPRPARFFFGGRSSKEVAEELRQQQAAMWRNIPIQGVRIDDIEFFEIYSVFDESDEDVINYAPMELKVTVDSLEECLRFVSRDEFRRIEFLEPAQLSLSNRELERILYKFGETIRLRLKEQEPK